MQKSHASAPLNPSSGGPGGPCGRRVRLSLGQRIELPKRQVLR